MITVAAFLDEYFANYVEGEGLKSVATISGHIKAPENGSPKANRR